MTIRLDTNGNEFKQLPDGSTMRLGLLRPSMAKMRSFPQYEATLSNIPRANWPKKGGGLRAFFKYTWNQGRKNSCSGHGSGAAFTAGWNYQGQANHEFSPTFIYGLVNGGRDNGGTPLDVKNALEETGVCLRSTVGPDEIYSSRFPKSSFTEAASYRADNQVVFTSFDELVSAVLREQAVYTGIFCGGRFDPDSNGLLPDWDGSQVGGHCTAQIGEVEYLDGRGWGVWTKNSWGNWGVDGWAWAPESYFGNGNDGAGLSAFSGIAIVSTRRDPHADPIPTPIQGA